MQHTVHRIPSVVKLSPSVRGRAGRFESASMGLPAGGPVRAQGDVHDPRVTFGASNNSVNVPPRVTLRVTSVWTMGRAGSTRLLSRTREA